MKFYIPSRGRPGLVTPTTLKHYGIHRNDIIVVVRLDEVGLYARPDGFNILVLPKRIEGLASTRQWILEVASGVGGRHWMMDDDITGFLFKPNKAKFGGVREATKSNFYRMLEDADYHIDSGATVYSTQDRMSIARPSVRPFNEYTRIGQCMYIDHNECRFKGYRFDRTEIYHDQDLALQIVRGGDKTVTSNMFGHKMRPTYAKGGLQTYRKQKVINAAAKRLCELHPGLVKLRWKKKHGFNVPSRIISWKKAREG